MSYQERRAIVSLLSTVVITAAYFLFMLQRYPDADAYSAEAFHFWGAAFLILIPVYIIAKVIIQVVFIVIHIVVTNEGEPDIIDERDKLIELKATAFSYYCVMLGLIIAMFMLVLEQSPDVMFSILIGSVMVGSIVWDVSQFYFYRNGV